MSSLLRLSRLIDWINERVGRSVMWLVIIAVVISAGNALVRKLFNTSSNALLEIEWYLFAALFMLAAGYTFLRNEHVRIDILTSRLSPRAQNVVDIVGILLFLMPMAGLILCRAHELSLLIADDDAVYGRLDGEHSRNPFPFSREPADELRLHRDLAARGLVPVAAWDPDARPSWRRAFAALRIERAAALGLAD